MKITKEIRTAYFSEFRRIKLPDGVILFTSALAGEGKTFITIELAIGAALRLGNHKKVLIIDLNSYNNGAAKDLLGDKILADAKGIVNVLTNENSVDKCIYPTHVPKLSIMPYGKASETFEPLEHLQKLNDLIQNELNEYLIFIDAGSVFVRNRRNFDPSEIAQIADHVILIVMSGKTPRELVLKCKKDISRCGGKVSGVIMNDLFVKAFRSEIAGYLSWFEYLPIIRIPVRYLRARFGIY